MYINPKPQPLPWRARAAAGSFESSRPRPRRPTTRGREQVEKEWVRRVSNFRTKSKFENVVDIRNQII